MGQSLFMNVLPYPYKIMNGKGTSMKRMISDAESILKNSCRKENMQEEYLYRNSKELLHFCQKIVWSAQKESGSADNDSVMELMEEVLRQLQLFPVVGYLYADILRLNYFSNISRSALSVRKMVGLGETAFFSRKRQAVLAFGLTLAAMAGRDTIKTVFDASDPHRAMELMQKSIPENGRYLRAS